MDTKETVSSVRHTARAANNEPTEAATKQVKRSRRGILGADLTVWAMLILVALGLPRTVLADLGILVPEGSWLYYVVALAPYAVWLAVAVLRRTATPIRDHLLVGALYALSLVVIHELFWNVESSQGHNPPRAALELASGFASPVRELVIHGYEFGVATMIGVGSGAVMALVALAATGVRRLRGRRTR